MLSGASGAEGFGGAEPHRSLDTPQSSPGTDGRSHADRDLSAFVAVAGECGACGASLTARGCPVCRAESHREAVSAALCTAGLYKDAERFDRCGDPMALACGSCGHRRLVKEHCERKICPECAHRHSVELRRDWEAACLALPQRGGMRWKFITLTLRASGNLDDDYDRLRAAWRRLRESWTRRGWGRKNGVGGTSSVEVGEAGAWVKYDDEGSLVASGRGTGRNVHLHVLAYMPWVAQKTLSEAWLAATGDSGVVDVRVVQGGIRRGIREVAKYITKLSVDREPAELVEIYEVFKGAQTHRAWGALHGTVRHIEPDPEQCPDCQGTKWWPSLVVESLERARGP